MMLFFFFLYCQSSIQNSTCKMSRRERSGRIVLAIKTKTRVQQCHSKKVEKKKLRVDLPPVQATPACAPTFTEWCRLASRVDRMTTRRNTSADHEDLARALKVLSLMHRERYPKNEKHTHRKHKERIDNTRTMARFLKLRRLSRGVQYSEPILVQPPRRYPFDCNIVPSLPPSPLVTNYLIRGITTLVAAEFSVFCLYCCPLNAREAG